MAYRRSAPTFSFFGTDQLKRTVTLFPDSADLPAQIGRPPNLQGTVGGTLTLRLVDFVAARLSGHLAPVWARARVRRESRSAGTSGRRPI